MTNDDRYGKYALSQIQALRGDFNTLSARMTSIQAFIDAFTEAGFTPEELADQIEAIANIQSLSEVRDYASELNSNSTLGFLDLVVKSKELVTLASGINRSMTEVITSGIIRFGNAINLNGISNYSRSSSKALITSIQVGSTIQVSIITETSGVTRTISVPFHQVTDNVGTVDVTPHSMFFSYTYLSGFVTLAGYAMYVDLSQQTVTLTRGEDISIPISEFAEFLSDIPFGLSVCSAFLPGYVPDPEVYQSVLYRQYGTDELYHVFREYVTHMSENLSKSSLAGSYGQAAIAAIATANNVLQSTIVRTNTTYDFSGSTVMSLAFQDSRLRVTGHDAYPAYTDDTTIRYFKMDHTEANGPEYLQSSRKSRYTLNPISYTEGLDLYADTKTLLRQDVGSVGIVKVSRITDVGTAEIDCEFTPIPDSEMVLGSDPVAFCGYINPDGSLEPQGLEYIGSAVTNWNSGNNFGQGSIYPEFAMIKAPTNPLAVFAIGGLVSVTTPTRLRVRLDASRILEVGSSTTIEMTINGTYNGLDISGITVMTRRYVNTEGTGQRLVYEGFINGPTITSRLVNGFVTTLMSLSVPKQYLVWGNSILNTQDPLWDENYFEIRSDTNGYRTYIQMGGRPVLRDAVNNTDMTAGKQICRVPLVHTDTRFSTDQLYYDVTTGNQIPLFTPYNYPLRDTDMIVIGKSSTVQPDPYSYVGTVPRAFLQIPQSWPVIVTGSYPFATGSLTAFGTGDGTGTLTVPWLIANSSGSTASDIAVNSSRPFYQLIMPTQNAVITTISVSDITELSLPEGVYSNTELTEDSINLWNTVQLLLKYTQNLQELINDLTKRITVVEDTLPKIIDAIKSINDTLRDIIDTLTPKPSPWGVAGGILSFLSTAVGMFFPIIGTAIGVLGQIVIGTGQIVDGDVSNGILELTVGAFTAGLGLYKFGKRMKEKYKRENNTITTFDVTGKFKVGTYVKNTSVLPSNTYRDSPPSYDSIYPDNSTRVTPLSSKVKTSSVSTGTDDLNRKYVENEGIVMDTYQANNFSEFDWMSIILSSGLLADDTPSNIIIESNRTRRYLGEPPYDLLSDVSTMYVNGTVNEVGRRVALSDLLLQEYFDNWPLGGIEEMCKLRDVYCDIDVPQSSFAMDRDIILPMLMSHGGSDSREISSMMKYRPGERLQMERKRKWVMKIDSWARAISILDQVLTYDTNPSIPYSMLQSPNKDSPASRDAIDRMTDFWQNNDLSEVLTDIPDEP